MNSKLDFYNKTILTSLEKNDRHHHDQQLVKQLIVVTTLNISINEHHAAMGTQERKFILFVIFPSLRRKKLVKNTKAWSKIR